MQWQVVPWRTVPMSQILGSTLGRFRALSGRVGLSFPHPGRRPRRAIRGRWIRNLACMDMVSVFFRRFPAEEPPRMPGRKGKRKGPSRLGDLSPGGKVEKAAGVPEVLGTPAGPGSRLELCSRDYKDRAGDA